MEIDIDYASSLGYIASKPEAESDARSSATITVKLIDILSTSIDENNSDLSEN